MISNFGSILLQMAKSAQEKCENSTVYFGKDGVPYKVPVGEMQDFVDKVQPEEHWRIKIKKESDATQWIIQIINQF